MSIESAPAEPTIHHVILPVIVVDEDRTRAVCGTGFILGNFLVTCWHCVMSDLPEGQRYAAARRVTSDRYDSVELGPFSRDLNGADLAVARLLEPVPSSQFRLRPYGGTVKMGMDVSTFGYPLPDRDLPQQGGRFTLHPRVFRGYMTRGFLFSGHSGFSAIRSLELDMPAPEGLSGAPLLAGETTSVMGVIYGAYRSYTIEDLATVDPESGERRPETQRVYTFGLACDLNTLLTARTASTKERPLAEHLRSLASVTQGGR